MAAAGLGRRAWVLIGLLWVCIIVLIQVFRLNQGTAAPVQALGVRESAQALNEPWQRSRGPQKGFLHEKGAVSPVAFADMALVDIKGMRRVDYQGEGGIVFYTYPEIFDIHVSASIGPDGYYEKWHSDQYCAAFQSLTRPADFLDVGANIGSWTLPMAVCLRNKEMQGSVIAIEAVPDIAHHLEASIAANALHNVRLYNFAVGSASQSDSLHMHVDAKNKGASSVVGDNQSSQSGVDVVVQRTTIDNILEAKSAENGQANIFLMKMDIEGFEHFAFAGAMNLLKSVDRAPCLLVLELRELPLTSLEGLPEVAGLEGLQPLTLRLYVKALLLSLGYIMEWKYEWDHGFRSVTFAQCQQRFMS